MKKGAQPSDRVMRFLDKAGVAKRDPLRNNPERALPRKERKAAREEKQANKAADAAKAEAKNKADAASPRTAHRGGRREEQEVTM